MGMKRLHRWIDFDGAVFGSGIVPGQGLHITSVCIDGPGIASAH
jgi:hypothetical protein